jgi:hypothetical protein
VNDQQRGDIPPGSAGFEHPLISMRHVAIRHPERPSGREGSGAHGLTAGASANLWMGRRENDSPDTHRALTKH